MLEVAMAAPQPKVLNLMSGNDVVLHLYPHLHDIPAARVANFTNAIGVRDFPHIARVGEMTPLPYPNT